jgi:PBSX family phage terminase large subunit
MILTPAQESIAIDTHRFRVVNCGRRFGKTVLAIEEIKGVAIANESRIAYIAPNFIQARDIAWSILKKQMESVIVTANEARLELTVRNMKGTTSLILLRGWEAVESLRGQSFDFIVIDEIASMRNYHTGWEEVLRPTLTDRKGSVLFISTPKGFNHFYDLYIKEASDTDYKSFHFTTYDNPHIPTEEIDKAKIEMTEDRFAQEYLADFRKTSGLVYKEFDRERHIYDPEKEKPTSVADRLCGVDFGYTNPAGILLIEKDTDGVYWVTQEFYEKEKSTAEIIEIAASFNARKYYPDPAEPDRIREMKNYGLNVRDVSKDKVAGINLVREMFKCNRIKISSHCLNFIWELETYHYPENRQDKNENEEPVKKDDHLCDCCRYIIYMQESGKKGRIAKTFYPSGLSKKFTPQITPNKDKGETFTHYPKFKR